MRPDNIIIEQALYGSQGSGGYRFLARSPGFKPEWVPAAEQLCVGFGERPAGVGCPACIFAQPLGKSHVVVVQVADQGQDDTGRPGALGFRLLVMPRDVYIDYLGDPFLIADQFPPPWDARDDLPTLTWTTGPLPPRRVAEIQEVLKRPEGPALLGGVQALVDGGRLVFQRAQPDPALIRGLWMLLPTSTRCELWPASFAFSNRLGFHALVVARAENGEFTGYVNEEQAENYPEGRYELNLQIAAEAGDQAGLDHVFARRSRAQTWRMGLFLLVVFSVVVLCLKLLTPQTPPANALGGAQAPAQLDLPPAEEFHTLNAQERDQLTESLRQLAQAAGVEPLPEPASAEKLLDALDTRLGTPNPNRDPGADLTEGPVLRRLRALLWKHEVADYRNRALSGGELVEKLRAKLIQDQKIPGKHDG
jgi:hypothetical protein